MLYKELQKMPLKASEILAPYPNSVAFSQILYQKHTAELLCNCQIPEATYYL